MVLIVMSDDTTAETQQNDRLTGAKAAEASTLGSGCCDRLTQQEQAPVNIYHERQSKQLCALHALNNLFQNPQAFRKAELDAICNELAPTRRFINPHRSTLGLGCYDVNVIILALSRRGYDTIWFDKRKELSSLEFDNIFGLILNVPNTPLMGLLAAPLNYLPLQAQIWNSKKHWISVRKIGRYYYELDSKLNEPICIGGSNGLLQYLECKSSTDQVEILLVVTKTISENKTWLRKQLSLKQQL